MADDKSSVEEAIACYDRGDYKSSLEIFERLLSSTNIQEEKDFYLFNVSACHATECNYSLAIQYLNRLNLDQQSGFNKNCLLYNRALCHYKSWQFQESLECLDQLVNVCQQYYPDLFELADFELSHDENTDSTSTIRLQSSCLVQAINLKSAILYKLGRNRVEALEHLVKNLHLKDESSYDGVSLHNRAIFECGKSPMQSMNKLLHLLDLRQRDAYSSIPNELYQNILMLYLTFFNQNDQSSKFFVTHRSELEKFVSTEMIEYLELHLERASPMDENHYEKQSRVLEHLLNTLSSLKRESPNYHSICELVKTIVDNQALILWHNNQYRTLERLLNRVKQFLFVDGQQKYQELWQKNMSHTLYMMDTRYEDCIEMYEDLLPKSEDSSILDSDPELLASLCVAFVLTGRNADAEQLIKEVELEENEFPGFDFNTDHEDPDKAGLQLDNRPLSHSSHINLAIETLYCVKGNFEFSLGRMFKTVQPLKDKLSSATWLHAKRCILALLNQYCKRVVSINDDLFDQIVQFLMQCEVIGAHLCAAAASGALIDSHSSNASMQNAPGGHLNTITFEARYLRSLILNVIHD